ncbi:MAG: hypothetical protein LAP61_09990 [Acidobacteriia bacterium]|nr:hypothetical protein [Terriglobia bacterium]
MRGIAAISLTLIAPWAGLLAGQNPVGPNPDAEDFHVYRDAPRLLLTPQRLRLLQREHERQSPRWEQYDGLISGSAPMPEPGFAWALYYQVTRQPAAAKQAIDWALKDVAAPDASVLRQLALVFDWCGPAMTPAQADRLATKIQAALAKPATDVRGQNARVFAAIALADRLPDQGNAVLSEIVQKWWRAQIVPQLAAGRPALPREQRYALYEMLHVLRDNVKIDLRESAAGYFKDLPLEHLTGHYPAPFAAPENEFLIPVYLHDGNPNPADAAMSRATGLAMVAYDSNALDSQLLQGWLLRDRFMMRGSLGAVYEFLWANPYQPGLNYDHAPLVFHEPFTGEVFARTSWDEDATWIGYFEGRLQLFQNGKLQTLRQGAAVSPVQVGTATVVSAPAQDAAKFRVTNDTLFVLGLAPQSEYAVEIDDQELEFLDTDAGGTLQVPTPGSSDVGVRVKLRGPSAEGVKATPADAIK